MCATMPRTAASAGLAGPLGDASVLVCDGRGEATSHLAGRYAGGQLEVLASQPLPHSLGLFYEQATSHLGFLHSSDEYKVMALASYGTPRFAAELSRLVYADGDGGFRTEPVAWDSMVKRRAKGEPLTGEHADLAASVQQVTEDVLLDLARWLHGRTGDRGLAMAGGVALNCVANSRLASEGPFDRIWVQPAAGDAGTALGGALCAASEAGEAVTPMPDAFLGRGWSAEELAAWLDTAAWPYERPASVADAIAAELAADRIVAWFQGRSEFGPRALGGRSLLAHPGRRVNLDRLNAVKGREEFRPVGADGAGRAGGRHLPRAAAQPVHAVRAPGGAGVAGPDPRGRARGRDGPGADRGPRASAAGRRGAGRFRRPHRPARDREHQPEHRRAAHGGRPAGRARMLRAPPRWTSWPSGRS